MWEHQRLSDNDKGPGNDKDIISDYKLLFFIDNNGIYVLLFLLLIIMYVKIRKRKSTINCFQRNYVQYTTS